jgi:5-methylcytosine-specific restriction enzyme A
MPRGSDEHDPVRHDHDAWITCALCLRSVPPQLITQHHLKPKRKGGKAEHRTPLCKPCHKQVHATFGNTDLARMYDSVEALREAPLLQPFLKWVRKQSADRNFRTLQSKDHPRHGRRRY